MLQQASDMCAVRSFLITKYAPQLILLGGSRATGNERPDSDWDLFLIGTYGATRERVAEVFEGKHLDLELVPSQFVEDDVLRIYYGPVRALEVLLDDSYGRGKATCVATKRAYTQGPAQLAATDIRQLASELGRLLSKIEAYVDEPVASAAHAAVYLQHLLPCWFALRREWSMPPHLAVPYIREQDPTFFEALLDMIDGGTAARRASGCRCAYERIFSTSRVDHAVNG